MQLICIYIHMSYAKQSRQQAIADIIRSTAVSSQHELAQILAERGFDATQATISRDLEQIGAIKVRRSGRMAYGLAADARPSAGPRVETLLREYAQSVEAAANLVVIKTPPGSAHLIGVALDTSRPEDVVGNICGDDTIFVACRSNRDARDLSARLNRLIA
jgi:transcriptional regulator of arginine metabolism